MYDKSLRSELLKNLPITLKYRLINLVGEDDIKKFVDSKKSVYDLDIEEYKNLQNKFTLDLVNELLVYLPESKFLLEIKNSFQ